MFMVPSAVQNGPKKEAIPTATRIPPSSQGGWLTSDTTKVMAQPMMTPMIPASSALNIMEILCIEQQEVPTVPPRRRVRHCSWDIVIPT